MTEHSPSSLGTRTAVIWNVLVLVLLYASCGIALASMSASAGLAEVVPYGLAVAGTVVVAVCFNVALAMLRLAMRQPAQARHPVALATAVVLGTYAAAACLLGIAWSINGLATETGETGATWVTRLTVSLAALVLLIVLAIRTIRRPRVAA